jgi:hypothetical protein
VKQVLPSGRDEAVTGGQNIGNRKTGFEPSAVTANSHGEPGRMDAMGAGISKSGLLGLGRGQLRRSRQNGGR